MDQATVCYLRPLPQMPRVIRKRCSTKAYNLSSIPVSEFISPTKTYSSLTFIFYVWLVGNFIGPFFMTDSSAPRYLGPLGGYLACNLMACLLLLVARINMKAANQHKRSQPGFNERERDITLDLTDQQDPNFLYRL